MNPLQLLKEAKEKKLKPTATVVRKRNGSITVERGDLLSETQKEERISVSREAGKRRKGLSKAMEEQNTIKNKFPIPSARLVEYEPQSDSWLPFAPNNKTNSSSKGSIKVVSFNVWFSQFRWKQRLDALLDLTINEERAEIICLQEVTSHFLEKLLAVPAVRANYRVAGAFQAWYGVAMLVSKSLPDVSISMLTLPTKMGRAALLAKLESEDLTIATVHLESLNSAPLRKLQLARLNTNLVSSSSSALLVGDMNVTATGPFGNRQEHEQALCCNLPGFVDVWTQHHGTDADDETAAGFSDGTTYDCQLNGMLQKSARFFDRSRLDRAFLGSVESTNPWSSRAIRIIGKEPITQGSHDKNCDPVWISDHFGLAIELFRGHQDDDE